MKIKVNSGESAVTEAMQVRVIERIEQALRHVRQQVTRVEVHLRDDKRGRKGPDDLRCLIEARIAGQQPLVVEATGGEMYRTIDDAAGKLQRAVDRAIQRRDAA